MLAKRRYEIGLDKLMTTESSVSGMKEELIALQPQLEVRVFLCVCDIFSHCISRH